MATSTNLDVSLETAKGLERRLTVKVPNAEIEREVEARLRKMGKTVRLKGFRPGKVPAKVVRQRYGGQIRQEVLSDVIRSSFSRAVSEQQLNPAGGPAIEPIGSPDDEHFSYRAIFEVYPEVALADVDGLKFEKPAVAIETADVDRMIERLREQRADWQAVERKAAEGDRVIVDFVGTIDKEPFEGGEGKDVPIELGAGQVIADFEKALKGVQAGENKVAKVKFPKDYGVESLAGQKAEFDITVSRVEEQVLPQIDEEFMAAFGVEEGGMEAFRADVEKNMQRELDDRLRAETKNRALNALHDANRIEVPRALVEQEVRQLQADAMRRLGLQDPEKAPAAQNFVAAAEKRVRLGLLVQELISKHKLELDRKRVDERIMELSSPYENPEEAAQLYRSNRELMSQVESAVLEEQVVEFLVEQGKVKEKRMNFEEFMNMGDAD